MEVGTGHVRFHPLEDGDEIELVMGPQLGWHLDVTARLTDAHVAGAWLEYLVYDPDEDEIISMEAAWSLCETCVYEQGGALLRLGDRVVLEIDDPSRAVGHEVDLQRAPGPGGRAGGARSATPRGDRRGTVGRTERAFWFSLRT